MDELKLYYRPTCPYCKKVLRYMKEKDLFINMYSTDEPDNLEFLIKYGGMNQVPCLFINDKPLYESDLIIEYFMSKIL